MDRRQAIKRTAMILGGAVFAPNILGVLQGCTPRKGTWNPEFFSHAHAEIITLVSDTILPEDDFPSASQVGVPGFIEQLVEETYTSEQQEYFIGSIQRFADETVNRFNKQFTDLTAEERHQYVQEKSSDSVHGRNQETAGPEFIRSMKELTLLGYFTSEEGATQVLRYMQTPGPYRGCGITLDEVGRAWAT